MPEGLGLVVALGDGGRVEVDGDRRDEATGEPWQVLAGEPRVWLGALNPHSHAEGLAGCG
ncbi:hypothetical protein BN12_860006 [Nostocoides japonicum T1-X7]|uniref:Uncharacterized protein n=1 Tax=Nostocoides japonicum T1-X7 TaxID=1194083 RepID=A0A077M5G2_9MICO|nr:hypothetical protein [Tetrasphaera japonica]CCH80307.1 hypothetical protein BN12_860006 [Tetrasphaera japonica T1-X7]